MTTPAWLRHEAKIYNETIDPGLGDPLTIAADKIERLEARGADAIAALRACLSNPQLSEGQRTLAEEALARMFTEQERWWAGPGPDPEASP